MSDATRAAIRVELAAKHLAGKRVEEAAAFLRFRINAMTDRQATAQAVIEMDGAVEEAQAAYEIALAELRTAREDQ